MDCFASDIYQVGLVLFELFTGESAYKWTISIPKGSRSKRDVVSRIAKTNGIRFPENANVDPKLQGFIWKLTSPYPGVRPKKEELEALIDELDIHFNGVISGLETLKEACFMR
jgi:hypothetical protein